MTETLYLIDGHAIAYRAYFALTAGQDTSRWMTPDGEPTAGTFGFSSILLRVLENNHPDYLAVAVQTIRWQFRKSTDSCRCTSTLCQWLLSAGRLALWLPSN